MANPTIGFIGYGNMAQAIAEGLVNAGTISGNDIVALRKRCIPPHKWPKPPTWSSSPSNHIRLKR